MYVTRQRAFDETDDPGEAGSAESAVRALRDREEVIDALYRFGLGQDLRDRELFASAFTADAVLDFRPAAEKCGLDVPLMTGRDVIVGIILNPDVRIDTTHVITNCRVQVDGDTARLTAIVEAQHLPKDDHTRHGLLKNLYAVDLVRDGSRWLMRHVHIDNVWYTGDPAVLTGK